jgi:hypothetical protein
MFATAASAQSEMMRGGSRMESAPAPRGGQMDRGGIGSGAAFGLGFGIGAAIVQEMNKPSQPATSQSAKGAESKKAKRPAKDEADARDTKPVKNRKPLNAEPDNVKFVGKPEQVLHDPRHPIDLAQDRPDPPNPPAVPADPPRPPAVEPPRLPVALRPPTNRPGIPPRTPQAANCRIVDAGKEISRAEIDCSGHHGTISVSTGVNIRTVNADRSKNDIPLNDDISISYSGSECLDCRWVQFTWREVMVWRSGGGKAERLASPEGSTESPLTTDPSDKKWHTDANDMRGNNGPTYCFETKAANIRDCQSDVVGSDTMFDRPGATYTFGAIFRRLTNRPANQGDEIVTIPTDDIVKMVSVFHADTYLVCDYDYGEEMQRHAIKFGELAQAATDGVSRANYSKSAQVAREESERVSKGPHLTLKKICAKVSWTRTFTWNIGDDDLPRPTYHVEDPVTDPERLHLLQPQEDALNRQFPENTLLHPVQGPPLPTTR